MPVREQAEQLVLDPVGVLVFVHQHLVECRPPLVEHLWIAAQQADEVQEQVVEVHAVGVAAQRLVALVDGLQHAIAGRPPGDVGGRPALGLRLRDGGPEQGHGMLLGVDVELRQRSLEDRARVLLVEDGEAGPVAEPVGVGPQHAGGDGVEGPDPEPVR